MLMQGAMAVALPLHLHLNPTFRIPHLNAPKTTKILFASPSRLPTYRFYRSPRSCYHDNNYSDEAKVPADDGIEKVKMEVSPSVLKALEGQSQSSMEEDGLGLIERNKLKRAARFAATQNALPSTKPPPIALKEEKEDSHQGEIYEAFKSNMPTLQKPGNLDIDILLNFIVENTDLDFVIPSRILIGTQNQKLLDENLIRGSMPSIYLAAQLRAIGGFKFERDKEWYSERLALLIVYNYLVQQMKFELDEKNRNESKAEKLASTIGQLEPLVMTVVAPELLVLYAFENSGFVPDGRIVKYEDGFIFPGRLKGQAEDASAQIQKHLDLTGQDSVVIFMKSGKNTNEDWCVVAPWSWLLGTILPDGIYNWVSGFSYVGAFVGALQFRRADPGLEPIVWEAMIIPSLLLGIAGAGSAARWLVGSKYDVAHLIRWPVILPFPSLGAAGVITGYRGCVPNRGCMLNLSLASISTSLALSSFVAFLGYSVGSSHAFSDAAVDFHGYFLVPMEMFSYSSFFTFLLRKLSIASFREEMGNLEFVINPMALAGLLGLNFCSFQLLPLSRSDGARILAAILGRDTQQKISLVLKNLLPICFLFKNPLLAFAWAAYVVVAERYDDLFLREEISEPSLYGKLLGLGLVSIAFASFVPLLW